MKEGKQIMGKRLALVTKSFYSLNGSLEVLGGVERYTRDLAFLCRKLGYEVTICQFGVTYWERIYEGIKVKAYPWNDQAEFCIENIMKTDLESFDCVIYMWIGFQRAYHPNSISISHGVWFDDPDTNGSLGTHMVNSYIIPALQQLRAFVTVDLNFLNYCRCVMSHAYANKMIYIPNYVDTDLFQPGERIPDGMIEILYPRRYDPYRGIYLMQEIAPRMLEKYPMLRFNFAIDKTYDHFTSAWIQWLESQPHRARIRYYDYPMDQMPKAYFEADIVVIPSISSEGTSFSALEAMACGKAIVSSNIGGLSNLIIPNYNGKIVNPSVSALESALEEYINSETERKMHGENARRVVETSFTKNLWERHWTRVIREVFGA